MIFNRKSSSHFANVILGVCGSEGSAGRPWTGGTIPVSPVPRADVSLGKILSLWAVLAVHEWCVIDKLLHIDALYDCVFDELSELGQC